MLSEALAEARSELCGLNESVERTIARWQQMYDLGSDDDDDAGGIGGGEYETDDAEQDEDQGEFDSDIEDDDMAGLAAMASAFGGGTAAELGDLRGDLAGLNSKVSRADEQVAQLMARIQRDLGIVVDSEQRGVRLDTESRVPSARALSRTEAKDEPEEAVSDDDTPFSVTQIIAEANAVLEQREEALGMFEQM